jgi:hypothetical protein
MSDRLVRVYFLGPLYAITSTMTPELRQAHDNFSSSLAAQA